MELQIRHPESFVEDVLQNNDVSRDELMLRQWRIEVNKDFSIKLVQPTFSNEFSSPPVRPMFK